MDLYNALNGTDYTDPDALKINTIENVIYLTMHNDVSFLIDEEMNLYEQQSTHNPNMPLRGFMYFAQLYQIYLTGHGKNLFSSRLVRIPTPRFVVFYNGSESDGNRWSMRLSDAFINEDKSGGFEWTADVINMNPKCNRPLQKKCKALYDYIRYVYRIKENWKSGMSNTGVVEEAVDWAISKGLLGGFFKRQKAEVLGMSLTEFDEEEFKRTMREEGYEDGLADGMTKGQQQKALEDAENLLRMNVLSFEQIAQATSLPLEKVREIAGQISAGNLSVHS